MKCMHAKFIHCKEQYNMNLSGTLLTDAQKLKLSEGHFYTDCEAPHPNGTAEWC